MITEAPPRPSGGLPERARSVHNPLWVISLFLGLSEVVVGAAATQATGWSQVMWATFSVFFPTAVAAAFFYILLTRPIVLYSPRDYSRETPVDVFAKAMSGRIRADPDDLLATIRSGIEAALADMDVPRPDSRSELVERAVGRAEATLQQRLIHVSLPMTSTGFRRVSIPNFGDLTLNEFMDRVWFEIGDQVPAYTYGETWMMRNLTTNADLDHLHALYVRGLLGFVPDGGPVAEAGIHVGDELEVTLINSKRFDRFPMTGLIDLTDDQLNVLRAMVTDASTLRQATAKVDSRLANQQQEILAALHFKDVDDLRRALLERGILLPSEK